MSRRSERELKRAVDDLDVAVGVATFTEYWFAGLKAGNGVDLTAEEERLREDPERYLSAGAMRELRAVSELLASRRATRRGERA